MKSKFWHLMVFLALVVSMLPVTVAAAPAEPEAIPQAAAPVKAPQDMTPQLGAAPKAAGGIESLSGSTVTFAPSVGGDVCYIPGATQTFCFNAHSMTADWEYVYNVWVKFPTDWTVINAYVQGTPACTGGGTWGDFSWSFQTSPYEVNVYHPRYQAYTDDCTAYYCFEVMAGAPQPYAPESWYWDGDGYNYTPHNPCSSDQYTPSGQNACDEYVNPQAQVPVCAMDPGLYLLPETQVAAGCNGVAQEHTVSVYNNTGTDGTFALSYSVPSLNGTLTGPASVFAAQGAVVPFVVTLTPDLCAQMGALVVGQIDGAGNGYTDTAVINKTVETEPSWEAIAGSAPSWPGYGYPRDGCTALNAAGESVTYLFGDTTSIFGFWGYNHDTNTWYQPAPAGLPADRWAPDWAYDPATNLCYVTGGANTPGGGTYTEAYRFDPVANSFTALGSFTSARDFHNSWVGTIDGVKYLCLGGGVNASNVMIQSTQCYDLSQAAPGAWNAENAQMAAFPTDPFGAADGILHAAGGDQFWYVGGAVSAGASISDEARYWDDADNAWHLAGNTGVPRYRVEGDFFNGAFYQLAGSSGGFTPTADVVRGTFDGVNWNWTAMPLLNNVRMDNVMAVAEGTLWSVDGYGGTASAYVEKLVSCPMCDLQGWLEGTVLDGDTQPVAVAGQGIESLTGSNVTFFPQAGGNTCYTPGQSGTYCFRAESFTNDYEYRYSVWLRFPATWIVNNAYLVGTPVCDSGASWDVFSWLYETAPYEIRINHIAWQTTVDHCVATYCVDVGQPTKGVEQSQLVSWYWDGDGYNNVPHHPCSSDQYTPVSMSDEPCDEWVNPQASVPECAELGPACTAATVTINPGNITVGVDPTTGHYGPVMLVQGEYQVEATAPGYSVETATVAIVDEMTTTQDFVLYRPVIDVSPTDPISVYAEPSTTVTIPLTISNLGHLPLEWEIYEIGHAAALDLGRQAVATVPPAAKIEADLVQQLADGPADFFIWMAEKADLSLADTLATKEEKGRFVFDALRSTAERTQLSLRASLDQQGIEYEPYYIANKILVRNGSEALALQAASRLDVARITANHKFQLEEPFREQRSGGGTQAVEPNISFVFADQVWAMGFTGQGIILAGNDTGLDETHPTIARHYRGCLNPPTCDTWDHNYNWWDATDTYPSDPYDGFGHGTHTTGTMVGDDGGANQIGMAPGAQTIHCKNMTDGGGGEDATFIECFQWDLAPWDLTGANPNPDMAPDAVNNSWGYGGGGQSQFEDEIAALQAAGILVEVSAGNEGPSCGTLRSPGDYVPVLTTGSVDHDVAYPGVITVVPDYWSTSRGPSSLYPNDYFPDVMAPGNGVRSALPGNSYDYWGGTSMAGPHSVGLVGLMWSAAPGLRGQVAETMDIIRQTAGPLTGQTGSNCGGDYTTGPNNDWGFGTINALAAVEMALTTVDLPWVWEAPISGTIPPLEQQLVDVMFHCTPDQEGLILTGTLRINHSDPCAEPIDIPIELICGEPTDPDIEVVPPALSSIQLQDEQVVQTLNINNVGTADLDWTIIEHNPGLALAPTAPRAQVGRPVELKLEAAGGASVETNPPVVDAPVSLVLDDGSADNYIGLNDGTYGFQFLWLNRFTPAVGEFPFNLTQISVVLGATGVAVGDPIDLVVYQDTDGDGDPGNATWLATYPVTVQYNDGASWNDYPLATALALTGPGDVLIGVINRYQASSVDPSDFPAALDQTTTQQRSWVAAWSTDPPVPPVLPPDAGGLWGLIDQWFPGNWMIRGYGETGVEPPPECEPVDIPWATVDPISGTTPGYGTFPVDVTFDSTAMASGTYTANLCVESNDPDEPFVIVPLTMTVLAPQNIEVTPSSLTQELCPDATATQQITICNTGDLPLEWEMTEITPTVKAAGPTPAPKVGALQPAVVPVGQPVELKLEAAGGANVETNPPVVDAPVTLILDDGSRDNDIGLGGTIEMLWVNRFTPAAADFPFNLNQIQIYFSSVGLVNVGDDIVLIVYENTTGNNDPAVGANFLGAFPTTVQALDTWNVYDLATPIYLAGPGDVIIGAIGMETPGTSYWPASIDQTATQARSWAGWWNASPPPTPPTLPPDNWTLIDAYFPGNWMVRGYGETAALVDVPWLSENPVEGTIPGGECQVIDVTFDSTGLTAGDYFAALFIESDDPDTPEITIPVQLTVLESVTIDNVAYTLDGLQVTFDATVSGGAPFTYAWDFGDGYTSALEDPVHVYAVPGCYTVTLVVSNQCGEDTWTEEICVQSGFFYYYVPLVFEGTGTPWPPPDRR